jgi:hypothetical protein
MQRHVLDVLGLLLRGAVIAATCTGLLWALDLLEVAR